MPIEIFAAFRFHIIVFIFFSSQIAPAEIEQVINTVPGVADVGVAGIKVSQDSSHPMALVVKDENSDVSEEEIVKCVNGN